MRRKRMAFGKRSIELDGNKFLAKYFSALPEDWKLVSLTEISGIAGYELVFEHDSFPELPEGTLDFVTGWIEYDNDTLVVVDNTTEYRSKYNP